MNISRVARITHSRSPAETRALARALAATLKPGDVLALHGELGSGKTCFVQGLARALGVRQAVTSPTFTMVSEYRGRCPFIHMDFYRIQNPGEFESIDFEHYLDLAGIVVIEWAERAGDWIPGNTLHLYFKTGKKPSERTITVSTRAPL